MAHSNDGLRNILLQLPSSLGDRAEEMASRERVSLNLFVATAVAEKLQRCQLQSCLDGMRITEVPLASSDENLPLVH